MRLIGTINKRIDIGITKDGKTYIMSSSNCIEFNEDELECLFSVLSILTIRLGLSSDIIETFDWFPEKIDLWEPAPPPAEIKIL